MKNGKRNNIVTLTFYCQCFERQVSHLTTNCPWSIICIIVPLLLKWVKGHNKIFKICPIYCYKIFVLCFLGIHKSAEILEILEFWGVLFLDLFFVIQILV
jgi:hypothetical protein